MSKLLNFGQDYKTERTPNSLLNLIIILEEFFIQKCNAFEISEVPLKKNLFGVIYIFLCLAERNSDSFLDHVNFMSDIKISNISKHDKKCQLSII